MNVLLNGDSIFSANKQKLTKKFSYFRAMLSPHLTQILLLELNFDTSVSKFKQVIGFLNTGSTSIDFLNLFEIYKLSLCLQVEELIKLSFGRFVESLKLKHLEACGDYFEKFKLGDGVL